MHYAGVSLFSTKSKMSAKISVAAFHQLSQCSSSIPDPLPLIRSQIIVMVALYRVRT
jgi:hypothetical protein